MSGDHNMYQSARQERDPLGLDQHEQGAKLDAGKIRPTLIFCSMHRALRAVIDVGEYGARKYTVDGWQFVDDGFSRYTEAMYRHLLAENESMHDEATNLLHAAHAAWNALARLELLLRETESGDRMWAEERLKEKNT